jgi:formate dehydrogenase subunit gamma
MTIRTWFGAIALSLVLALGIAGGGDIAGPASAQQIGTATTQPGTDAENNAAMWRAIRQGSQGQVSIPDTQAGRLIQSQGESWRSIRNGPLSTYGAWALLGMVVLLALFFVIRGRIRIEHGWSGRTIERFNGIERFAHWLTATTFIVLALTGLNLLYGRYVLLPLIGPGPFATISMWGKIAHNYVAFAFALGVLMMLVLWVRHNIPNKYDLEWVLRGGGLFTRGSHPPSRKFNAGQKVIFWSVVLGGIALTWTGVALMFPFEFGNMRDMQFMQLVHAAVAVALIAIVVAHIYIGTLGMEGAFDAMGTGMVDENWAREHHNIWVAEVRGERLPRHGHDD